MSSSFAVVVCHGSYHTPSPYQPFLEALRKHGIEAYCPQLPSSDLTKMNVGDTSKPDFKRDPPPGGKHVVLFGHSSGGFSATASAIPALQSSVRKTQGRSGGVVGIFYLCAMLVPPGESVHSFFQPKDGSEPVIPPYCQFPKGFEGLGIPKEGAKYFFNGLDDAQAKHWESTLTASPVPTTLLENDAYAAVPCAYLVTENDLALPAAYQEGMIALQKQRTGIEMTVLRCSSGHSPFLTRPEELAAEALQFGRSIME